MKVLLLALALTAAGAALLANPVLAQMTGAPAAGVRREPGVASSALPAPLREIGFDQNLDARLPLDLSFVDEQGRTVRLGAYFGETPVVLLFVYYDCPLLCSHVLGALASTLDVLSLDAGRDFQVVTISIDPREKPALAMSRKSLALERYKRPGASEGWHFLTGEQPSIDRLTKAAGFRYVWDDASQQFAHPTGIIVATPDGRPARYLFGIEYGARDLRLALVEAADGKIGTRVDSLLLYCYHYDPMTGRYGLAIMRTLRVTGALTVLALLAFIVTMIRRDRRRHPTL
jgi:protein SCO1/2